MPGKTGLPIRPERGGITTSASPESAVKSVSGPSAAASPDRKASVFSAASWAAASASPRTITRSPSARAGAPGRAPRVRGLDSEEGEAGIGGEVHRGRRRPDPRRALAEPELEDTLVEPVLLDERPRVAAEVGRDRLALPVGQQAVAEEHDDRDRPARAAGPPRSPNSKKPNGPPADFAATSDTRTLTGVPVRASMEPACDEKTNGIRSWEGGRPRRTAITTTTGRSAATAPLGVMTAVRSAEVRPISTSSRPRLSPAWAITSWPAHAVTPVVSRPALTTKSAAMKTTTESPRPPRACRRSSTPVK